MSYEEEDTCMSYEEEDTCMSYEEEDTCMSYEEEDTCSNPFSYLISLFRITYIRFSIYCKYKRVNEAIKEMQFLFNVYISFSI
jgi:hypothetical protein